MPRAMTYEHDCLKYYSKHDMPFPRCNLVVQSYSLRPLPNLAGPLG
jgi:hypothetical protein